IADIAEDKARPAPGCVRLLEGGELAFVVVQTHQRSDIETAEQLRRQALADRAADPGHHDALAAVIVPRTLPDTVSRCNVHHLFWPSTTLRSMSGNAAMAPRTRAIDRRHQSVPNSLPYRTVRGNVHRCVDLASTARAGRRTVSIELLAL